MSDSVSREQKEVRARESPCLVRGGPGFPRHPVTAQQLTGAVVEVEHAPELWDTRSGHRPDPGHLRTRMEQLVCDKHILIRKIIVL